MSLSVVYVTSRRECHSEWFFSALEKQIGDGGYEPPDVIVVDHFHEPEKRIPHGLGYIGNAKNVAPKPCVWSGKFRLTKEDWFSAANARNTALCLCRTTHIVFVDDLSVPLPGWYDEARNAAELSDTITLGAYRKVRKLVVKNGMVTSFDDEWEGGRDSRWNYGGESRLVPCNGDILYGCSFVAPVEALLSVGGFPELCNGLGFEDVIMGIALQNAGFKFLYNKNMMTFESDEHHGLEPAFRRESFERHPNDPADKAHSVLNMMRGGTKYFENYYEGGIRRMREEVLNGGPFPILNNPAHCWHTGKHLSEL